MLRSRDTWKDVNKIGELLTQDPVDTSKGPKCLTFFFMMNGKSINRLNIFLRVNNRFFKVWQRKGHQGDDWQRGAISLPKTNVEYFVSSFQLQRHISSLNYRNDCSGTSCRQQHGDNMVTTGTVLSFGQ